MNWKEKVADFEEGTIRVLQITQHFLCEYYACRIEESEALLSTFLTQFAERVDEDLIHDLSSYRLAGLVYFTIKKGENFTRANELLIDNDLHNPPPEAFTYFRQHYFEVNKNNPFTTP